MSHPNNPFDPLTDHINDHAEMDVKEMSEAALQSTIEFCELVINLTKGHEEAFNYLSDFKQLHQRALTELQERLMLK